MKNFKTSAANCKGSVLLETVLVLPLYIAFFSGVFLVGDLSVCMGRKHSADRVAVMQKGNRHTVKGTGNRELTDVMFLGRKGPDYGEGTRITGITFKREGKGSWSKTAEGYTELTCKIPDWTAGWQRAVNVMFNNGSGNFRGEIKITKPGYYVFMRVKDTSREDRRGGTYGENRNWTGQCSSPDPLGARSLSISGSKVLYKYTRYGSYVTWSDRG